MDHNETIAAAYNDGLDCADRSGKIEENPCYKNTEQWIAWHSGFTNRTAWKAKHVAG